MMIASQIELIARLDELIARLRARKKDKKKGEKKTGQRSDRGATSFELPGPSVLLLGSPQMENQASVFGSERGLGNNYDKEQPKAPKMKRTSDRRRDVLTYAAAQAAYACRLKQMKANAAYYRCRAKKGGSPATCRSQFVSVPCPEAAAARKALSEYLASRPPEATSGGGGGGGF